MQRVVVTRALPGGTGRIEPEADVWVWPHDRAIDRQVLVEQLETVDGLLCMLTDRIDRDVLSRAPNLRVVSTMAVGVDHIDLEACRERGIPVGHTPDVLTDSTADQAWALLLAASRRLSESIDHVRDGEWLGWEPNELTAVDVSHSTLGIFGMGRIGRAVAERSAGFDMDVVYTSRSDKDLGTLRARRVPFDELLSIADHVVICASLSDETDQLFGDQVFASMKSTASLVNIARGRIVDTDALVRALRAGTIRCAGLDVTDPEPIPVDHPLVSLPNCTIVPHLGSATERTRLAMADLAVSNLLAGLAGTPLPAGVGE